MAESPGASPHQPVDILTEMRFWHQIIGDAKRTICCHVDIEERVRALVAEHSVPGQIKVVASPACPENKVLIFDEQAIRAGLEESIQKRSTNSARNWVRDFDQDHPGSI